MKFVYSVSRWRQKGISEISVNFNQTTRRYITYRTAIFILTYVHHCCMYTPEPVVPCNAFTYAIICRLVFLESFLLATQTTIACSESFLRSGFSFQYKSEQHYTLVRYHVNKHTHIRRIGWYVLSYRVH